MKILITEAVDKAFNKYIDALGKSSFKEQYRSTHFKPILVEYKRIGEKYYDTKVNKTIEATYRSYLSDGKISRGTFNKRIRGLKILEEVMISGDFEWKVISSKECLTNNVFTPSIDEYISTRNLHMRNIDFEKVILTKFSEHLIRNDIFSHQDISYDHIVAFMKSLAVSSPKSLDKISTALSKYMRYIYDRHLIAKDISHLIKVKRVRDHKVKKAAATNDIKKIVGSIDRESSVGKRDYAIIILACTTGLRAGDIINIRLNDIDWKNKEIRIVQGKNNTYLQLPLDNSVCSALIDYILNGRPKTTCDKLFIRSLAPYVGFNDGVSINNMLRRRSTIAGVTIGGSNTIHGIRRMIASEMIKGDQSVYTVAQILGHKSIKPTRQYVDLNTEGLRICALSFSDIKGGQS